MEKIKIAIVGYGGMGKYHAALIQKLDFFEVAGIYDISQEAVNKAEKANLKVYKSADQLAKDSEIKAILIATPNDNHIEYVKLFSDAKKHIICEKPMALSSQECLEMYASSEKNKTVLMINQNRRWDKDYITVKKILEDDLIKDCYLIESRVMGSNGIPGGWRKKADHGGGMMLDWGVHLIDQVNLMTDKKLTSLYCTMSKVQGHEVDDGFKLTLKYGKDLTVEITVDTNCFEPLPRWMLYGKNGTAIIRNWELDGAIIYPDDDTAQKLYGMKAGNGFTKTMAYRTGDRKCEYALPEVEFDPDTLYKNFYNAIIKDEEPIVQKQQVLEVFKIMENSFVSAEKDMVIKF